MPQRIPLDILTFLQNYRLHPCLWNRNHPQFKNRIAREEAEAVLLPISGLSTVKELRQKIRNIRCTYNQELGKIRRSINAGASEIYEPKLVWFAFADSFLRVNHIEKFEDPNAILSYNPPPPETNGVNFPFLKQEFRVAEADYPPSEGPESANLQSPSPMVTVPTSAKRAKTDASTQDKFTERSSSLGFQHQNSQQSHYGALTEFVETVTESPSGSVTGSSNEFVVFGQHVAAQLQQLPIEEAIRLEEEIQSAITRARLRSMQVEE